jgi:hypoxanthine-guanine phosphoribosyltransferase
MITKEQLEARKAEINARLSQAQQSYNTLFMAIQQLQGQIFLIDDMLKNIDIPTQEATQ